GAAAGGGAGEVPLRGGGGAPDVRAAGAGAGRLPGGAGGGRAAPGERDRGEGGGGAAAAGGAAAGGGAGRRGGDHDPRRDPRDARVADECGSLGARREAQGGK